MSKSQMSKVETFYEGQQVLFTGASGMLGTAYISRLVLFTNVSRIYALVRGGERRLWDIWKSYLPPDICEALQKSGKVIALDGDITLPDCGLHHSILSCIRDDVTIVVHAASTISLKKPLVDISPTVIYASQSLASLALSCSNLVKFVYISSAYAGTFLRRHAGGAFSGQDAIIAEDINHIRSSSASLDAELADLKTFGKTPEYDFVRHLHTYTYAKHVAERVVVQEFERNSVQHKLMIFRPSAIGPAEKFPAPFFEIPGSCPVTTFIAALLIAPPFKMRFSCLLTDPSASTCDEIPVDIASNRLIVHTAYGSTGCVHAVPGNLGCQTNEGQWERTMKLRRSLLGRPRLVWCQKEWSSDKLCALSRLFPAYGNAFKFDDLKTEMLWDQLSDEEQTAWPLWAQSNLRGLDYFQGRKLSIEVSVGRMISKAYGLPSSWSQWICGRFKVAA